ncbi:MAG: DEAD/DEAH box helicase [Chthoniobacter sp.]|uniref:DEAD/DEAH box helicase n=1 Tax=Chthoniobacter sp. TaxID=2510640 RepID=UPI0032AD66BF
MLWRAHAGLSLTAIAINTLLQNLVIPDLWQQDAVRALREGRDVVVHAPTGAGKTYVFELFLPELKGQAIFTVPTRALANDKLAEWQTRGWDVGISTGDVASKLDAKVIVATLETQKGKFLQRLGPRLLVVDEYQMIADAMRGVNYELALALAPAETQLLLLSGSVANPQDIVAWLRRIGRDAVLVSHAERPVPLEEVDLENLPNKTPSNVRGRWPRLIGNALRADLGPILLFAPRRRAAEELARDLASALPADAPLHLTFEQQQLAGPQLAKLLSRRIAFHHSGLSYAQRAGLVEPLAKAGQLRAVVATMGLAAGINFSMRAVVITDTRYMAGNIERQVSPDEVLQMFGRAGRRGLDDIGYALISDRPPRLHDGRPRQLKRPAQVDWPTLIAVMHAAAQTGADPFAAALDLNTRLFTAQPVPLGIEHARQTGPMPCGLSVDMERARFARRGVAEMLNSRGEWESLPAPGESTLGEAMVCENDRWRPALSLARTLDNLGLGNLCKLEAERAKRYGREAAIATQRDDRTLSLAPWLRRLLRKSRFDADSFQREVVERLLSLLQQAAPKDHAIPPTTIVQVITRGHQLLARQDFSAVSVTAFFDRHGQPLSTPPERRELPPACRTCPELAVYCERVEITPSPAYAWRRLGLIDVAGAPTQRGVLFSFFHHGEGLAVAAALEDESYPIEELVFDLANLRAGPRFAGDDSPYGGRLGALCQRIYERADLPGYLDMGVPIDYGAGASEVVREIVERDTSRTRLLTESLRQGDLERALVEWRSLLRHIIWAPDHDLPRWRTLKSAANELLEKSTSPTIVARP